MKPLDKCPNCHKLSLKVTSYHGGELHECLRRECDYLMAWLSRRKHVHQSEA